MRRTVLVLAFVAGAVAPATNAFAAALPAINGADGIGIRLIDAPSNRRDDPRARVYIIDHLAPGATIQRRIEISNSTATRVHVTVYPAAAAVRDGKFAVADGATQNELTTWISTDRNAVDLDPRGLAVITAKIQVPPSASSEERYGVIWAQVAAPPPAGGGVAAVNRVGIRVYLSVGPGGEPRPDFKIDSLTPARAPNGQPVVQAQVHNTGGRALDMSGTLRLSEGPGGLSAGPFPAELGTTLGPGDSEPVTVLLDKRLPNGPWRALIQLESGLIKRSAQATLTFPDAPGASGAVPAKPVPNRALVITTVIAVAVAVLLLLLLVWWRRRSRTGPAPRLGQRDTDAVVGG